MKRYLLTLLAFALFTLPGVVWGADMTIYMSAGGSATSPYDTWAKGATTCAQVQALTLDSGTHTINLRPGDTFAGYLDSDNWTAAGTITIKGLDGDGKTLEVDGKPIITGGEGATAYGASTIYGTHIIVGKAVNLTINDVQIQDQDYFASSKVYAAKLSGLVNITITDCVFDGELGTTIDNGTHRYNGAISFDRATGAVSITDNTIQYWGPPCLWATPEIPAGGTSYTSSDSNAIAFQRITAATASVTISGNTISNVNGDGIVSEHCNASVPIIVTNNQIKNAGENAIDIKGSNSFNVYSNWMYRDATFVGMGGSPVATDPMQNGVVQFLFMDPDFSQNNLVEKNLIGPTDTSAFAYKGNISNNIVRFNEIIDAKTGVYFCCSGTSSTGSGVGNASYNNRYIGCDGNFMFSYGYRGDIIFENETFYSDESMGIGLDLDWFDGTFQNCIFRMNDSDSEMLNLDSNSATSFENNIWYNADAGDDNVVVWAGHTTRTEAAQAGWNGEAIANGEIFGDPGINSNGYASGSGSAVVNAGATPTYAIQGLRSSSIWEYGAFDIATIARADNGGADIGAGEYFEDPVPPGGGVDSIAYDANSSSSSNWGTSLTWEHTVADQSDRLMVVYVATKGGGGSITGVTFNGDAMTCLTQQDSTVGHKAKMCYLLAPDVGAHNIIASVSPISTILGTAISVYGVEQAGPDANAGTIANATTISNALTSITDNSWVITGATLGVNTAIAPTQGETERVEIGNSSSSGVIAAISTELIVSAGENTFGYGTESGRWAITSAAFKGSGGADVTAPTITARGVCSDASCTACTTDLTDAWGAETVRVCAALSEDVIVTVSPTWQMDCGPIAGDKVTGSYFQKIDIGGTKHLTAQFTFTDRMRFNDPQLYEMTGGTIQDGSGNDLDTSGSAGDISSGTLTIGVPGTFSVGTFSGTDAWDGQYATMTALRTAVSKVNGDEYILGTVTEPGALDLSGDDCTESAPCRATLSGTWTQAGAGLTTGDWWEFYCEGNSIVGAVAFGANNTFNRCKLNE